jgi:hypothetical protein
VSEEVVSAEAVLSVEVAVLSVEDALSEEVVVSLLPQEANVAVDIAAIIAMARKRFIFFTMNPLLVFGRLPSCFGYPPRKKWKAKNGNCRVSQL